MKKCSYLLNLTAAMCLTLMLVASTAIAGPRDLNELKASGVLRHLGITYANFVTGLGDGLDVELIKLFAKHLGVKYEFVATDWDTVFPDLIGEKFKVNGTEIQRLGQAEIKGDIIADGLTVIPWRQKVVDFSKPTFPTQVWLVVKSDSKITPIEPTGDINKDIELTRGKLKDVSLLCKSGTCLDPALFNLPPTGAKAKLFPGSLNDLAPAVILGDAEATLLDVPDALVALQKFPGKIKIVGPLSGVQDMAVAFAKSQPALREEFNRFLEEIKKTGEYDAMIRTYYPLLYNYFPNFLK